MEYQSTIEIYTDGACSGNPGPGGWAFLVTDAERIQEGSGYENPTTNQRMELIAAIKALESIEEPRRIRLHTDSAYLSNCFRDRWFDGWRRRGWTNSKGDPVANRDLWERLLELSDHHEIVFVKVKGHADDAKNNRVDELAREAVLKGC